MKNKSTLLIISALVGVFVVVVISTITARIVSNQAAALVAGALSNQGNLPNGSNFDYLVARRALGLGGPAVSNAVQVTGFRDTFTTSQGTTTLCAFQNPFNATSSIQSVTITITTPTTSPLYFGIGTSTDQYTVNQTLIGVFVASSSNADIIFDPVTTTSANLKAENYILPPAAANNGGAATSSPWLTIGLMASSGPQYLWQNIVTGSSTTTPAGVCTALIQKMN